MNLGTPFIGNELTRRRAVQRRRVEGGLTAFKGPWDSVSGARSAQRTAVFPLSARECQQDERIGF